MTEPPGYETFVVVPLRVHVLSSEDLPEVDCHLKDDDVRRIVGKVNGVWGKAGVVFGLESIVREPAARNRRFRIAHELNQGMVPLGLYRLLVPDGPNRRFAGLHVYYIHDFSVNGVYMGEDFAIVRETARLREVEGGIDEPLPRVTAHELGHALGLSHRQDRTNLLASGTTGTLLNELEVETAKGKARKLDGARRSRRFARMRGGRRRRGGWMRRNGSGNGWPRSPEPKPKRRGSGLTSWNPGLRTPIDRGGFDRHNTGQQSPFETAR